MTVNWLQSESVKIKMSLFQNLKLKRGKVDSRCSSDGESIAEASSCSPDSGSSPGDPSASHPSMCSPQRCSPPPLHIAGRISPDSACEDIADPRPTPTIIKRELDAPITHGYDTPAIKREVDTPTAHVYDGGGGAMADTSTPMGLGASCGLERISPTPSPEHHFLAPLKPLHGRVGGSLGAGGMASINVSPISPSVGYSYVPTPVITNAPMWASHASPRNGLLRAASSSSSSSCTPPPPSPSPTFAPESSRGTKPQRTPTVIMGESGGVKTMKWQSPTPSPQPIFAAHTQREVLSNRPLTPAGVADTSGVRASVDGLLALAQVDRRPSPPQLSPSSTSPPCRSRSPMRPSPSSPFSHAAPSSPFTPASHTHTPISSTSPHMTTRMPLNMEKLWAGERVGLSAAPPMHTHTDTGGALNLTKASISDHQDVYMKSAAGVGVAVGVADSGVTPMVGSDDEEEQPMVCMICEDKATGLHYGIITCEGCKGFFKRTVQNKRVYTCVADGNCEITKSQRNRCQFCRFDKCLKRGMVLAAVREDRMPGGRNSGSVYNQYKVKYKKKKKNGVRPNVTVAKDKMNAFETRGVMGGRSHLTGSPASPYSPLVSFTSPSPSPVSPLPTGEILKAALTNHSEVVHMRHQRCDSVVSSSRERGMSYSTAQSMIRTLIECDDFEDIATLKNMDDILDQKGDHGNVLCDMLGIKLVQWTRRLPFYPELSLEVHKDLLTTRWHELLVLTTSTYQAMYGSNRLSARAADGSEEEFRQEMSNNLCRLQTCLSSMTGRPFAMDNLRQGIEVMVEKITEVTLALRRLKIQMEEYVCLKVIALLNQAKHHQRELDPIQERYMGCLRSFCETNFPSQPTRLRDLLVKLNDVQEAASILLETKMYYVPFMLCSSIAR